MGARRMGKALGRPTGRPLGGRASGGGGGGAASAPDAFTAGQWSVADAGTANDATVTITALPSNGGSAITALQYSIAGGAYVAFSGTTTGSYTIAGFTDGVATNLNIRAVNAVGSGAASDTKSVTTTSGATAPAAMTAGQWGVVNAGTGQATFNILALPANGGSAITDLAYKIGAGAWTSFGVSTTGSYTRSGFTDGVPTNTLVRAMNAIGAGADSDTKSVTTGALSAPAAFTTSDWAVARGGPNQARVDIINLPANSGRPIEGIQYRLNGGTWQDLAGAYAIGVGSYAVSGVTDNVAFTMDLRSHSWNVFSEPGDIKNISATAVAVTVPNQTAPWGAKTLAGGGIFRPLNSLGQPVDLTTPLPTLQSGSRGVYTEAISSTTGVTGGLAFTGAAGAPAGSVWRCNLAAGGTVDITIGALEANCFHVQTIQQASTAYGSAVLGDTIRFRAGDKNLAMGLVAINRGTAPAGTWTGAYDLSAGNWVTVTRDVGHPVTIGAIYVNGAAAKYLRLHDLDFLATFTGNGSGGSASISSTIDFDAGISSTRYYAVTNCRSRHDRPVVGTDLGSTTSPYTFIRSVYGGPCWFEGNVIAGGIYGIQISTNGSTPGTRVSRNIARRCQEDAFQISDAECGIFEQNLATDKIWQHRGLVVTAITAGNPTVITVADTTGVLTGGSEFLVFTGFTGDWAQHNGKSPLVASKTATTITITFNSTGLVWDGLGGIVRCPTLAHGDYWQFQDSVNQNSITFRGNVNTRGQVDGHWMPTGQGIFANGVNARRNWLIEGNISETELVRALSIANLNDSVVRSNTGMRPLGVAGGGASNVSLIQDGGGTGNIYRDNLFPAYFFGSTAAENTNNVTVNLIATSAVPANATDVATAESHFANPPTTPDEFYDGRAAFATRMSGGAQAGPTFAGATPYFNFDTLAYSNPRAHVLPRSFLVAQWTLTNAGTAGDAIVDIRALPWNGGSAITALEYSIAGGAWTAFSGTGTGTRTIPGFTDGVATNVNIRVVTAIGASATSDTKSVTTS